MVAFFVVTSLVNMGLGYALAVYLSRARANAAALELATSLAAPVDEHAPASLAAQTAPPKDDRRGENRSVAWPVDEASEHASPARPILAVDDASVAAAAEPPGVERDLLAGLEEFRQQLAQMKGHVPADEPAPAATADSAAG